MRRDRIANQPGILGRVAPALGIGAYHALTFVTGHVIWSIGAPIAIIETPVPSCSESPWLGPRGRCGPGRRRVRRPGAAASAASPAGTASVAGRRGVALQAALLAGLAVQAWRSPSVSWRWSLWRLGRRVGGRR